MSAQLHVCAGPEALATSVADWLLEVALAKAGPFALCLSGGSTPKGLYERLAQPPYRDRFPWARTHLFWGDERFVPPEDERSNYRMVKLALLDHAPIPEANIHPVPTVNTTPEASADTYAKMLKQVYGAADLDPRRPLFDVNLLGLGDDGHTASLFPGADTLRERQRWCAAVEGVKDEPRITLTFPVLDSAAHAVFLVAGQGKRAMLSRLLKGDPALPSAHVAPVGALHVFADQAAAGDAA